MLVDRPSSKTASGADGDLIAYVPDAVHPGGPRSVRLGPSESGHDLAAAQQDAGDSVPSDELPH